LIRLRLIKAREASLRFRTACGSVSYVALRLNQQIKSAMEIPQSLITTFEISIIWISVSINLERNLYLKGPKRVL
jgi:hypothetical protein